MAQAAATTPAVPQLAQGKRGRGPLRVLIGTLISARTKDAVTSVATERLFSLAATAEELALLEPQQVARAIHPAGFYRTKGGQIVAAARMLRDRHGGEVPATREELMALPGVGRKTANLVLGVAFRVPAICVDIHVHRISNRVGWVATATPLATEERLMQLLPRECWIEVNRALVSFGQRVCTPRRPSCEKCPLARGCPKVGVAAYGAAAPGAGAAVARLEPTQDQGAPPA